MMGVHCCKCKELKSEHWCICNECWELFEQQAEQIEALQHEYDTTRGLWCIDRKPIEVDYAWIIANAFQLKGEGCVKQELT